uniref:Plasminogen receptor with a C-terminal lysine n=1 Tax=Malurus cyaneus samueli TaxID=2593467 RepID=A0A8C5X3W5_9PASS
LLFFFPKKMSYKHYCEETDFLLQLVMQNLMRERQVAMQIAWTREFLKYFGTFFGLAAVVLTTGAIKRKNPAVLLPILPLGFVFSYQYDMGYGTLLQRIKGEAESILDTQSTLLEFPKGPLTFEDWRKSEYLKASSSGKIGR